jgi:hypothetical protein
MVDSAVGIKKGDLDGAASFLWLAFWVERAGNVGQETHFTGYNGIEGSEKYYG